jgi:hypothetical protein
MRVAKPSLTAQSVIDQLQRLNPKHGLDRLKAAVTGHRTDAAKLEAVLAEVGIRDVSAFKKASPQQREQMLSEALQVDRNAEAHLGLSKTQRNDLYGMIEKPHWGGAWSTVKAAQIEASLKSVVDQLPNATGTRGASYEAGKDYKVAFDLPDRQTGFLEYRPDQDELKVWVGAVHGRVPHEVVDRLSQLFPRAARDMDNFMSPGGQYTFHGITQRELVSAGEG